MMRAAWSAALVAGGLAMLGGAAGIASDNDEDPPYLIYIDPETGKYTTLDPQDDPQDEVSDVAAPSPTAAVNGAEMPGGAGRARVIAVSAVVAAVLVAIAAVSAFRRRRASRRRRPSGQELRARSAR